MTVSATRCKQSNASPMPPTLPPPTRSDRRSERSTECSKKSFPTLQCSRSSGFQVVVDPKMISARSQRAHEVAVGNLPCHVCGVAGRRIHLEKIIADEPRGTSLQSAEYDIF